MKKKNYIQITMLVVVILSSCTNEEKNIYESVKLTNKSDAYKEYIDQYPRGEFSQELTDSFNLRKEEEDFNMAINENTIASYSNYVNNYSDGRFINEINDSIYYLKEAECFQNAKKEMSKDLFKIVIDSFPKGRFNDKAHYYVDSLKNAEKLSDKIKIGESRIRTVNAKILYFKENIDVEPPFFVIDYPVHDQPVCNNMVISAEPLSESGINGYSGEYIYKEILDHYNTTNRRNSKNKIEDKYKNKIYKIVFKETKISKLYKERRLIKLTEIK